MSDLEVKQTEVGLLNKNSCLAPALGIEKIHNCKDMIVVTLCCAA
jgi:hypothetical protein